MRLATLLKTRDSVKDIVSQNICHSHLLKAITFLHYMYQINDINNLIIHQRFFPSLNIIFVDVFKKNQSVQNVGQERKSGKKAKDKSLD